MEENNNEVMTTTEDVNSVGGETDWVSYGVFGLACVGALCLGKKAVDLGKKGYKAAKSKLKDALNKKEEPQGDDKKGEESPEETDKE